MIRCWQDRTLYAEVHCQRRRLSMGGTSIHRGRLPKACQQIIPKHRLIHRVASGTQWYDTALVWEFVAQLQFLYSTGGHFIMSRFCSLALAVVVGAGSLLAQTPPKVKVLILTGVNNHKWAETTPVLRQVLEQTGRFEVRVNEEVRGNGSETFAPYDVLLLN